MSPSQNGSSRQGTRRPTKNDPFWNIPPEPPDWALDAGLPYPDEGEGMGDYCARLGISYDRLVENLDPRATVNIHIRLVNLLADACPDVWQAHVDDWVGGARR